MAGEAAASPRTVHYRPWERLGLFPKEMGSHWSQAEEQHGLCLLRKDTGAMWEEQGDQSRGQCNHPDQDAWQVVAAEVRRGSGSWICEPGSHGIGPWTGCGRERKWGDKDEGFGLSNWKDLPCTEKGDCGTNMPRGMCKSSVGMSLIRNTY